MKTRAMFLAMMLVMTFVTSAMAGYRPDGTFVPDSGYSVQGGFTGSSSAPMTNGENTVIGTISSGMGETTSPGTVTTPQHTALKEKSASNAPPRYNLFFQAEVTGGYWASPHVDGEYLQIRAKEWLGTNKTIANYGAGAFFYADGWQNNIKAEGGGTTTGLNLGYWKNINNNDEWFYLLDVGLGVRFNKKFSGPEKEFATVGYTDLTKLITPLDAGILSASWAVSGSNQYYNPQLSWDHKISQKWEIIGGGGAAINSGNGQTVYGPTLGLSVAYLKRLVTVGYAYQHLGGADSHGVWVTFGFNSDAHIPLLNDAFTSKK